MELWALQIRDMSGDKIRSERGPTTYPSSSLIGLNIVADFFGEPSIRGRRASRLSFRATHCCKRPPLPPSDEDSAAGTTANGGGDGGSGKLSSYCHDLAIR